jgi:hypothetical protein
MATSLARAMAQPWVWLVHIPLTLIQPRKLTQPIRRRLRRKSTGTVTGFAKGNAKRLGSEAVSQA